MKPINEKERTLAFVQFLVLFILTIVLTIFFVFFDTSVKRKDYQVLKDENIRLKQNLITSSGISIQIDSLHKIVDGFSRLNETEYKNSRDKFLGDLKLDWGPQNKDTTSLGIIKAKFYQLFNDWSYSVGSSIIVDEKTKSAQSLKDANETFEKQYKDCAKEFEEWKIKHPC